MIRKNEKGFALVLSLVLMLAMSLMGGALIVMSGIIDIPKHHALLERSLNKYKDYVLYDKEFETSVPQS